MPDEEELFAFACVAPICLMYLPPRGTARHLESPRRRWADGLMWRVGTRAIPVLAADVNDQFGMRRDTTGQCTCISGRMVCNAQPAPEGEHAALLKRLMEMHHLCVPTSFCCTRATFFGEPLRRSVIDHFIPQPALREAFVLHTLRQASATHCDVCASGSLAARHGSEGVCMLHEGRPPDRFRLDIDRKRRAVKGEGREQFMAQVEVELAQVPMAEHEESCKDPGRQWDYLRAAIGKARRHCFPRAPRRAPEY